MVTELNNQQRTNLESTFESLNNNDIRYLVLRKFDQWPEIPGGDIDLLIHDQDYGKGINLIEQSGFSVGHSYVKNVMGIINIISENPKSVVEKLQQSPKTVIKAGFQKINNNSAGLHKYKQDDLLNEPIKIDARNHLAYNSPMTVTDFRVRVNPKVEEKMFDRRKKHYEFYVPSASDELAHIITHCLFDKSRFTKYYTERIQYLFNNIQRKEKEWNEFKELLDLIYYDASDVVLTHVRTQSVENLWDNLKTYSEY